MQDYCRLRHDAPEHTSIDGPEIFSQTGGEQTARIGGSAPPYGNPLSCDSRDQHGLGELKRDLPMPMIDVYAAADLFPAGADRRLAAELHRRSAEG